MHEPNEKTLFSFDIDLTSFGPWYGHRESSIPEFKDSINKLKELDIKCLVSAHRGSVTDHIYQQLERFYQKFGERSDKIRALIQEGAQTIDQLVERKPIYGEFPYAEPLLRYWEKQMIKKHIAEIEEREEKIKHFGQTL